MDSINYKYYREKGYLIGSGGIEGANKSVIQERLKLPGTKWIRDNAHYVAILRQSTVVVDGIAMLLNAC